MELGVLDHLPAFWRGHFFNFEKNFFKLTNHSFLNISVSESAVSVRQCAPASDLFFTLYFLFCKLFTSKFHVRMPSFLLLLDPWMMMGK